MIAAAVLLIGLGVVLVLASRRGCHSYVVREVDDPLYGTCRTCGDPFVEHIRWGR